MDDQITMLPELAIRIQMIAKLLRMNTMPDNVQEGYNTLKLQWHVSDSVGQYLEAEVSKINKIIICSCYLSCHFLFATRTAIRAHCN